MKWRRLDKEKPQEDGNHLVCWAEPYAEQMNVAIGYWIRDRFVKEVSGANEILFWAKIEYPYATKKLRTRRCK